MQQSFAFKICNIIEVFVRKWEKGNFVEYAIERERGKGNKKILVFSQNLNKACFIFNSPICHVYTLSM